MFEQSIYQPEPIATPQQEGDLFYKYELKSWDISPRLYKILAISALANILAVVIVSQTSLLTMKGCDSPLVGNVCQVLDTIYVGSKIFGTDREYVDAVYDKTEIGDADVTFVDVSTDTPPLSYPEGYFQIANPDEFAQLQQQQNDPTMTSGIPGIPNGFPITTPSTGNSLLDTQQNIPPVNPNPVEGDLPTFGGSTTSSVPGSFGRKRGRGGRMTNPTNADGTGSKPEKTPEAVPTPLTSDAVTAVEINKKPLADFADDVATKWDAKEVDLNQDFTITLNGVLTADGKLDRAKSKFDVTKQMGDQKMIDIGKAALEAVGDSGYLTYLKSLGVDKVVAVLTQDDNQITVTISSSQKTVERASTIASGINGYILIGKATAKNPSDERTLLDGAKVTSDGKNFVLNFAIPKPIAQEMITRKLREAQAKKQQQQQPNSTSAVRQNDNTAQK